jgi:hypothetical protein
MLLITCRDASEPAARPVRFLIEADAEALPNLPADKVSPRSVKLPPAA